MGKTNLQLLSRDAILQAQDLPTEDVQVPEWGGVVRVRGLTGAERDALEASMLDSRGSAQKRYHNLRARLVALTVVDEGGSRLFSDADVEALGRKSGAALNRVFEVASRLSGMRPADVDELLGN